MRIGATLVLGIAVAFTSSTSAFAQCVLKIEPMVDRKECLGFIGYSKGNRIGAFHLNGEGRSRWVAAGGSCPDDFPKGALLSPNKLRVGAKIYTLASDCKSSSKRAHWSCLSADA